MRGVAQLLAPGRLDPSSRYTDWAGEVVRRVARRLRSRGDMDDHTTRLHVICERDVGLFSLVQQVVANIPWAVADGRTPVAYFGSKTCYWTPSGYRGRNTVWEYYFEPLVASYPAAMISERVRMTLALEHPSPWEVGYLVDEHTFASSHYGDHPQLRGRTLPIPYQWHDPEDQLRRQAKAVIDRFIRPRSYILREVDEFFARHLAGHPLIGVHARGTDAISTSEPRPFRQGSLVLSRYVAEVERLLASRPGARIVVASDEQSSLNHLRKSFGDRVVAYDSLRHQSGQAAGQGPTGWIMPAYIAGDRDLAARNGEDAIIEYLLLSRCDYLVHNGSSLARMVLLNAPRLPHTNTHTRRPPS
jgi:hypothetical protein